MNESIQSRDLHELVASDHVRVLQGIAKVLGLPDYTEVTGEAVSAAIAKARGSVPDGFVLRPDPGRSFPCPKCGCERQTLPACAMDGCPPCDENGKAISWGRAPAPRSGSRHDLDRMADAIHALPGGPTMGRAIGAGR